MFFVIAEFEHINFASAFLSTTHLNSIVTIRNFSGNNQFSRDPWIIWIIIIARGSLPFLRLQRYNERQGFVQCGCKVVEFFFASENPNGRTERADPRTQRDEGDRGREKKQEVMRIAWGTCLKLGPCHYADERAGSLEACYLPARVQHAYMRMRDTDGYIAMAREDHLAVTH